MIAGFSPRAFGRVFDDSPGETRKKIVGIYTLLIAANAGAWVLAFVAFAGRPLLLGTALLAYTFGLRHAVDADHISAIDNVTRKLMQAGKKPVSVGFFFSLGHSTIVVALSRRDRLRGDGRARIAAGSRKHRRRDRNVDLRALPLRDRRDQPRGPR